MAMPAPQLEINTLYGWIDFSSSLVMRSGILAKRGRATQFDTSSPGTLSFTLNNQSNAFTPGTNAYGITKNSQVRLTISSYQVWFGYIDSMTTTIAAGYDQVVVFTATDEFKFFSKRLLSSYGIERAHDLVGAYSDGATYALQAPRNGVGTFWQAFRDTAASPIRIYSGTGGASEFTDDGPPFATPCIRLKPNTNAIGPVLEHPTSFNPGTENAVVSFWFKTNAQEPPNDIYLMDMRRTSGGTGYTSIKLESATGKLRFDGAGDSTGVINHTSTANKLWDANWHHVAVKYSIVASKTTLNVYIDGALDSTHTATGACAIASTNRRIVFGGTRNSGWTDNSYCLPGALAIIGVYKYTGTPNLTDIYGAGMDGDVGDTVATRLTALAGFVNVTAPTTADVSAMTLSGQDLEGTSYLDAVQDIAVTERGVFYIDRLGSSRFRGQTAKSTSASVTVTIDASKDLTGDFSISVDDALFANVVTASGPVGSYTTLDSTSVAAIGEVYDSFTSLAGTEVRLQNSAIDRLAERVSDAARLSKISIDLLTTPNSIVSTVIQLVPFDRVSVTNLPTAYTYVSSFDGFVEGWELAINDQSYTCSLDLSPVI